VTVGLSRGHLVQLSVSEATSALVVVGSRARAAGVVALETVGRHVGHSLVVSLLGAAGHTPPRQHEEPGPAAAAPR